MGQQSTLDMEDQEILELDAQIRGISEVFAKPTRPVSEIGMPQKDCFGGCRLIQRGTEVWQKG